MKLKIIFIIGGNIMMTNNLLSMNEGRNTFVTVKDVLSVIKNEKFVKVNEDIIKMDSKILRLIEDDVVTELKMDTYFCIVTE